MPEQPGRQPAHPDISETMVRDLVHGFYAKVRVDPMLGPIFSHVIGEKWDAHLERMSDFWSSVMLMSRRYQGNPMAAHTRLASVGPAHFDRWMSLFSQTAEEVCGPEVAPFFHERARQIAESLKLGMFYQPGTRTAPY
jgi:hemoglobin